MRGKPPRQADSIECNGLIPAYAGKTLYSSALIPCARAHPRVCGENIACTLARYYRAGSSPRMRGKLLTPLIGALTTGLIPAYAGKTKRGTACANLPPAHPRVCGENMAQKIKSTRAKGSSPRMRGKLGLKTVMLLEPGLIPAYAGKTLSPPEIFSRPPAHPRVCGENGCSRLWRRGGLGSSPRMRGKRGGRPCSRRRRRLIPAYAGKTNQRAASARVARAHPRVCGENPCFCRGVSSRWGSSPRMRGKRCRSGRSFGGRGLIPAYAGKTRARKRRN